MIIEENLHNISWLNQVEKTINTEVRGQEFYPEQIPLTRLQNIK